MNGYIITGLATDSDMRATRDRVEAMQQGTVILILLELAKIGITFPINCPHCGGKYKPSRYYPSIYCGGSMYNDECGNIDLMQYVPKKE